VEREETEPGAALDVQHRGGELPPAPCEDTETVFSRFQGPREKNIFRVGAVKRHVEIEENSQTHGETVVIVENGREGIQGIDGNGRGESDFHWNVFFIIGAKKKIEQDDEDEEDVEGKPEVEEE
jgi:hypothetical protein